MQALTLLVIFCGYFGALLLIAALAGRKTNATSFYNGNRKSPWFIVAFGMIGATLSGVTFISVPGEVGKSSFHYFQFILGNFAGYLVIAVFLLPYYYQKNVYSIYTVLKMKMGNQGYLASSGFFILSKIIGAAFRLYLAALVIHMAIAAPLNIPFSLTVLVCLVMIWIYTVRTGIKAIVWSDTLQTFMLVLAVVISIVSIFRELGMPPGQLIEQIRLEQNIRVFESDWKSPNNFYKQFFAGFFITIALNGFDQDIVQKNLTCRNSAKARKNMLVFSLMFVFTVILFLMLGALLYHFAHVQQLVLPGKSDQLFPFIALNHLGKGVAVLFILGISAAAFSSADSATTALTTAFSIDFLKLDQRDEKSQINIRNLVHLAFSILIFGVIMVFYRMNNQSVVVAIFKAAGFTYGPILGVFIFSFFINREPRRKFIVPICLLSPIFTYLFTLLVKTVWDGYQFGFELIIINGAITILLLIIFSGNKRTVKIH
ncbi:MAG: sodium:solute symporter [Prolixibacteraceae bacterium]|nr:sodium:solute symporter [Prolixibacteraceae bacterium]